MLNPIAQLGRRHIDMVAKLGQSGLFLLLTLLPSKDWLKRWQDICYQIYFTGVLSCLIIIVSGVFIGMVVGLQGYHTLEKFGATSALGQLLALSICRELGPVITALLFAGRAGSALTAEIGLMKATEQLASMEMMGVEPVVRVVFPRFIAGLVSLPLLTVIFSAVAVFGGYLIGVEWLGIDAGSFWSNMQASVNFHTDVLSGIWKSMVFALLIVWIALYQGMHCEPTAEGISKATTRTVVLSSLFVLGFDFILTAMMIGGW